MHRKPLRKSNSTRFATPPVLYSLSYVIPLKSQLNGRGDPDLVAWVDKWPPSARTVFSIFIAAHLVRGKGYLGLLVSQGILSDVLQQKGSTPAGLTTVKNGLRWLESSGLLCSRGIYPEIYNRNRSTYNIGTERSPIWRNKKIKMYVLTELGLGICEGETYKNLHRQFMPTDLPFEEKKNFIQSKSDQPLVFDSKKKQGFEGNSTLDVARAPVIQSGESNQYTPRVTETPVSGQHKQQPSGDTPPQANHLPTSKRPEADNKPSQNPSSKCASKPDTVGYHRTITGRGVTRWPEPDPVSRKHATTWKLKRRLVLRDIWHHLKGYDSQRANVLFSRAVRATTAHQVGTWDSSFDEVIRHCNEWSFKERHREIKYRIMPLLAMPGPAPGGQMPCLLLRDGPPPSPISSPPARDPDPVVSTVGDVQELIEDCTDPQLKERFKRMFSNGLITGDDARERVKR